MAEKPPLENEFAQLPLSVLRMDGLSWGAKALYGLIVWRQRKYGYCFESNEGFSEDMNQPKRTIIRWLEELKAQKLISMENSGSRYRRILLHADNDAKNGAVETHSTQDEPAHNAIFGAVEEMNSANSGNLLRHSVQSTAPKNVSHYANNGAHKREEEKIKKKEQEERIGAVAPAVSDSFDSSSGTERSQRIGAPRIYRPATLESITARKKQEEEEAQSRKEFAERSRAGLKAPEIFASLPESEKAAWVEFTREFWQARRRFLKINPADLPALEGEYLLSKVSQIFHEEVMRRHPGMPDLEQAREKLMGEISPA